MANQGGRDDTRQRQGLLSTSQGRQTRVNHYKRPSSVPLTMNMMYTNACDENKVGQLSAGNEIRSTHSLISRLVEIGVLLRRLPTGGDVAFACLRWGTSNSQLTTPNSLEQVLGRSLLENRGINLLFRVF